ncbi:BTAD domain-containing putative transcriptional regulator [Dactylosporangium sp. NPDC049525]|uniref:BTAD domain-containing putative transcriptional regulator n=1 Tax=Dactylosporangium sp. NPDC049525 TaxID=3154730 RepID=UPI00343356DF
MITPPAPHLSVLGRVGAWRDGVDLDLGGRRQRAVLALLIAARGRIVPADRLIGLVWRDEPPARASGVLQAYVSHLRRALEPDRPARDRTGLIVSASPGYAVRAEAFTVDAWQFEALIREWTRPAAPAAPARDALSAALLLWHGTPYGDYDAEPWAVAERAGLEELRLAGLEGLGRVRLELGETHQAIADLEGLLAGHPLREEAWRLLALALYRSGRQGDALAALRRARTALAETVGLDPGPGLRSLEADILAQAPHLLASAALPNVGQEARRPTGGVPRRVLVGRDAETAVLDAAARQARAGATVALVEGPAGSGKSSLLEALTDRLRAAGWGTAWGRCPEVDGAPALYPWATLLEALPAAAPGSGHTVELDPLRSPGAPGEVPSDGGDPTARRFLLHRAFTRRLTDAAASAPLLLVLDDLHRADDASLALLRDLLPDLRTAPVLLVATYRPEEAPAALTGALATLARHDPVRLRLGPLAPDAVGELVRGLADRPLTSRELASVTARSDGNPFHVMELGRLLSAGGNVEEVPTGVRDVVKLRISRLPDRAATVLRLAAVIGREVPTEVLLRASGLTEDEALDAVEIALVGGFLDAVAHDLRFSHVLVREALYAELSPPRRARMHHLVASTTEAVDPSAVFSLAHHYHLAGPAHAAPAARWSELAAEQAESRLAYAEAALLWRRAADAARAAGRPAAERLDLLLRLVRTLAWSGDVARVRTVRAEAVELAGSTGSEALLVAALTAWSVPTPWTQRHYLELDQALIDLAERALTMPAADGPATRCRLLCLLVGEVDGEGDPRTADRADEAVRAAEQVGDPQLLTLALNARLRAHYETDDLTQRLAVAHRVAELGERAQLPATALLGHQAAFAAHAGLADLVAARRHLTALEAVAERHQLGTGTVMARCAHALLSALDGDDAGARRSVTRMVEAMRAAGEHSGDSMGALCLFMLDEVAGARHDPEQVRGWYSAVPRLSPEFLVRALQRAGRPAEARALWRPDEPVRHDFLTLTIWTVRAHNALAFDEEPVLARCAEALAPYADQLAGASSGVFTLEPVAEVLARLATALGDLPAAHAYWSRALLVAERAGAAHFAARSRAALAS